MKNYISNKIWIYLTTWICNIYVIGSSNILILLPYPYKSHFVAFQPLLTALINRGHNITALQHFTIPNNHILTNNYEEYNLTTCTNIPPTHKILTIDYIYHNFRTIRSQNDAGFDVLPFHDEIAGCQILKDLLKRKTKYDLIILEVFFAELYYEYISKFQVPFIIFYANWIPSWVSQKIGAPNNPAYISYTHNKNKFNFKNPAFYERLNNFIIYAYNTFYYEIFMKKECDRIITNHYGRKSTPEYSDIVKNASLVLAYSNILLNGPKPMIPTVIEIGGMHITESASSLPVDIGKFINESEHGVIYFCMGSLLRPETLPDEKREAFLKAFARLPQRVLWKWNGELVGKTKDIYVSNWMPQRDIFAHPKVKVFISHGGALGMNEAIYEGIPILGIPIYGDQSINVQNLVSEGMAELLEYPDITEDTIYEKLNMLINDKRYKENAQKLSKIYRDRPMSPLDTAIYWTEYVIRHKGAHHLRSAAVNLSWYQYLLLDVIAFIICSVLLIVFLFYYICKILFRILSKLLGKNKKDLDTKKKNS